MPQTPERSTIPRQKLYQVGPRNRFQPQKLMVPIDFGSLSVIAGQSLESDSARIESLRLQFQQGTYRVDSTKVGQKILDLQYSKPD